MLPVDHPPPTTEVLRRMWAWLRPHGCNLTLYEALRHPTYSVILMAVSRGRKAPEKKPRPAPPAPAQADLFQE